MCRLSVVLPQAYLCDRKNRLAGRGWNLENCACCVQWLSALVLNRYRLPAGLVNTICKDTAQRAYFLSLAIEVMWKCVQTHFTLKHISMIYDVATGWQKKKKTLITNVYSIANLYKKKHRNVVHVFMRHNFCPVRYIHVSLCVSLECNTHSKLVRTWDLTRIFQNRWRTSQVACVQTLIFIMCGI